MAPVFTQLKGDVQSLKEAYDPGITMMPMGKIKFGSCTESGCTVHGTTMPSGDRHVDHASVHVTMNARFWGDGPTVTDVLGHRNDHAEPRDDHHLPDQRRQVVVVVPLTQRPVHHSRELDVRGHGQLLQRRERPVVEAHPGAAGRLSAFK